LLMPGRVPRAEQEKKDLARAHAAPKRTRERARYCESLSRLAQLRRRRAGEQRPAELIRRHAGRPRPVPRLDLALEVEIRGVELIVHRVHVHVPDRQELCRPTYSVPITGI